MMKKNIGQLVVDICIYTFLIILAASCIIPLFNILALSTSDKASVTVGKVSIIPINFNLNAYKFVFKQKIFLSSINISIIRILLGCSINYVTTVLTAYPLSKTDDKFKGRTFFVWFMFFTTFFSGGLVSYYCLMYNFLHINNTIWVLVLPTALPVFNIILLINFFRNISPGYSESAMIEGAGHWVILLKIYIPLSVAPLTTVTLFSIVFQWNSWFDGIIYMDEPEMYPLATYLQRTVIANDISVSSTVVSLQDVAQKSKACAQIFLGMLPMLIIYPFFQKYFEKGMFVGGIKE